MSGRVAVSVYTPDFTLRTDEFFALAAEARQPLAAVARTAQPLQAPHVGVVASRAQLTERRRPVRPGQLRLVVCAERGRGKNGKQLDFQYFQAQAFLILCNLCNTARLLKWLNASHLVHSAHMLSPHSRQRASASASLSS